MRFSDIFAASLVAPLVAAHGGDIPGAPKLFGAPRHLRARNPWAGHQNIGHAADPQLHARQGGDANGMCGPLGGGKSCAAGYCCSPSGWCGIGKDYCAAPDCLINYGPGCDANKTPYGATTKNDARTQLGSIAYGGAGIMSCLKPNTVAITYDDGPYIYTQGVMDQFEKRGARATFFVTGNNIGKGAIDEDWRGVIEAMYAKGHQIASHTWSHQNLDEITKEQRFDQMIKNEMAIRNIIGKYPTYMRPPYSACITQDCMDDMKTLGYVITSFDVNTDDYNQLTTEKIQVAKNNFRDLMLAAGPNGDGLAIAHDIHELSANTLTAYMLEWVYSNNFTAVTVGECMNDPVKNWYRDSAAGPRPSVTSSSSTPVPTPTGPTSITGQCGTANGGQSCIGFTGPDGISECCSAAGWCGRSSDHCGTGCNPLFGKCGTQPSISAPASVSVSKTSVAPAPTVSLPTSIDGDCGATALKTCKGFLLNGVKAECCSQYNYCGNTADYCGAATCNPLYGNCGSFASSSSVSASISKTSSAAKTSSTVSMSKSSSVSKSTSVSKSSSVTKSASSSAPASVSKTSSVSKSTSVSKSASSSAFASGSKSSSLSSSASVHKTSSVSSSASVHMTSSVSSSASVHETSSVSSSASVHKTSSVSSSASVHKTSSVSSSAPVQKTSSASASASVSKSASSSASKTDVKSATSTPVHTSSFSPIGQPSSTPVAKTSSFPTIGQPSSSVVQTNSFSPIGQPSSTPIKTSSFSPIGQPSSSQINPNPNPEPTPTKVYGDSYPTTFGTVVKPSSTPCDDDKKATPTPTPSVPISKDGKCGKDNGGQTCAGYKNPFGQSIECCCKESGRCSTDPWACGVGCDAGFGKCNKY